MKRIIIITVCLVTMSVAFGQIGLGIKAGVNLAGQTIKDTELDISTEMKPGFHAGAYVNYFIKDTKWGIQVEALVSLKGSEITYNIFNQTETAKQNLYYIDIPVLVRWQIIKFLNVHAGPQFDLLISAKETIGDASEDIKEELTTGEFAFAFGAEANLPFRINVTARYVVGITDIFKGTDDADWTKQNKMLMISLGFRIFGK